MSHGATCICQRCSGARRKAWREANRPRRLPAEDVSAGLVRLRAEGATYRELAGRTGLALGTVHRLVRGGVTCDPATQAILAELDLA
jgi:DNA invertase Pin-like site-specific DNA recombinase